jgi:hypothetical protein
MLAKYGMSGIQNESRVIVTKSLTLCKPKPRNLCLAVTRQPTRFRRRLAVLPGEEMR